MFSTSYNVCLYDSRNGSTMAKLDIDVQNGGMKLDEQFLVDFGADKNDILLAHEMRFVYLYILSYCIFSSLMKLRDNNHDFLLSVIREVTVHRTYGWRKINLLKLINNIFLLVEIKKMIYFNY